LKQREEGVQQEQEIQSQYSLENNQDLKTYLSRRFKSLESVS